MKLTIKESYGVRINAKLRKQLNQIAAKYSKWLYPREIRGFYDEVSALGVTIPMWDKWEDDRGHRYELNGETVENSLCVFQVYEGDHGKNEYNIYFS